MGHADKGDEALARVPKNAKPTPKYPRKGAGKELGWRNPNGGKK